MSSNKYEIIEANESGRRYTVRFKQYKFNEPIESTNWKISKNGCGPTCIATILASLGYNETPESIAKKCYLMSLAFYLKDIIKELMVYQ